MKLWDLGIVGGGPAGLAVAIEAARKGLSVRVVERQRSTPDKACGEGLMPSGLAVLGRLGIPSDAFEGRSARFTGIRYVQESGGRVEAAFTLGSGLGIRRLTLVDELHRLAVAAGAQVDRGCDVERLETGAGRVLVHCGDPFEARIAVACDGLNSPIRRAFNLDAPTPGSRRFGLRQHFRGVAVPDMVEVHWADGVEAYLTPVGPDRLGLAFLFEERADLAPPSIDGFLERFPRVRERITPGQPDSDPRGSGPLQRRVKGVVAGRLALLGDAAGYVDAITGEGLSLAFRSAAALAEALPAALSEPAHLSRYAAFHRSAFRPYERATQALLQFSRYPILRRRALGIAERMPRLFAMGLSVLEPSVAGPKSSFTK